MTAFMAAMAKEWAMPCGKIFAARGGRCDHSTTDVRGAQAPHVDSNPKGWGDPLDAGVAADRSKRGGALRSAAKPAPAAAHKRECRPIAKHGTRQALVRRSRSTGDPCRDHQSSDDL
ncbi:hypothetical protein [Burkholderia sp. BCC1977]|uniref:hypothetical protein n=1 Tax=Burkholderia sp. BCC1977 TaxID=2817440 RepID=UPI002ABD5F55|nr:hypothetical protein [Burkholderia sp. BCC1977]